MLRIWIDSIDHGVPFPLNNYKTTSLSLLLGEGDEELMVMWREIGRRRKKGKEIRGGSDPHRAAKGLHMLFRYYVLLFVVNIGYINVIGTNLVYLPVWANKTIP